MSLEKKFFFNEIGEVIIRKRRNVKRLSIRINPSGDVRMTIPVLVSFKDAARFLEEKREWVVQTRDRIRRSAKPARLFGEGEIMTTSFHRIRVDRDGTGSPVFRINGEFTVIKVPAKVDISDEAIQDFIRKAIVETLRIEARSVLIPRAFDLSDRHGFTINRVYVKNLKSRWGSCSSLNNINLNIHLMRLPGHLADYVILHELVHTIHRNHSAAFWNELAKYVPAPRTLARELRNYRTEVL